MDKDRGAYLVDCQPTLPSEAGQDVDGKLREALWVAMEQQVAEVTSKF
jgi:hypothetical protein